MSLKRVTIRGTHWERDGSGIEVLHADEPHALIQAVGYLKFNLATSSGEGVFFRGQRKLYSSLAPCLFREVSSSGTISERMSTLYNIIGQFNTSGSIFKKFGQFAHEPLLQHYGINTSWVDVVDNVWIALWFACHRAFSSGRVAQFLHFEKRIPSNNEDYAYIILIGVDIKFRNREKPGFYFGDKTELVDLRMATPSVFLRPHAQHGLLFRKKGDKNGSRPSDYADQIRGVIRVDLAHALEWLGEGKMVSTHSLFPPPYYDNGYQILLSCEIADKCIGMIRHIGA